MMRNLGLYETRHDVTTIKIVGRNCNCIPKGPFELSTAKSARLSTTTKWAVAAKVKKLLSEGL